MMELGGKVESSYTKAMQFGDPLRKTNIASENGLSQKDISSSLIFRFHVSFFRVYLSWAPPSEVFLRNSVFIEALERSSMEPVPSLKRTLPLKMGHSKREVVFQSSIFRCYVSFRDDNSYTPHQQLATEKCLRKGTTLVSFLGLLKPIFRGKLAVSFREGYPVGKSSSPWWIQFDVRIFFRWVGSTTN